MRTKKTVSQLEKTNLSLRICFSQLEKHFFSMIICLAGGQCPPPRGLSKGGPHFAPRCPLLPRKASAHLVLPQGVMFERKPHAGARRRALVMTFGRPGRPGMRGGSVRFLGQTQRICRDPMLVVLRSHVLWSVSFPSARGPPPAGLTLTLLCAL